MIIELTKDHTKPIGKVIKKGKRISVTSGHPYKDFEIVQKDGKVDKKEEVKKLKKGASTDNKKEDLTDK